MVDGGREISILTDWWGSTVQHFVFFRINDTQVRRCRASSFSISNFEDAGKNPRSHVLWPLLESREDSIIAMSPSASNLYQGSLEGIEEVG